MVKPQKIEGNSRLIYSTDKGAICPDCSKPAGECICQEIKRNAVPETKGKVRIRHETAGRKNKGVTIIYGLPLSPVQLENLAKKLKSTFGTGGAVKEYTIELQGDQRERAAFELRRLGFAV
ncbi:MAG: stress response translation initiation inhibitor YciH [Candidatus Omnitrophica bacterium]|nr:stress response translation initiation inhibitor YciH [Candidatus Omnitrophota bacterium]